MAFDLKTQTDTVLVRRERVLSVVYWRPWYAFVYAQDIDVKTFDEDEADYFSNTTKEWLDSVNGEFASINKDEDIVTIADKYNTLFKKYDLPYRAEIRTRYSEL